MRNDPQIEHDVSEALGWLPNIRAREIGVTVDDGVVTLTGMVESGDQKVAAERAASRVSGRRAITEGLTVRRPDIHGRPDADLAMRVVNALRWDNEVPDDRITVRLRDGWVTLEGTVEWHFQRAATERVLRRLTGIKGFTNLVTIETQVSTGELSHRIRSALRRAADDDASRIEVETHDGTVTLRGTVRSIAEREDAEQAAWSTVGVTRVDDRLVVAP